MKAWGLASTVALHLAALAGMLTFASQKVKAPQPQLLVSARLVPQQQKAVPLPAPKPAPQQIQLAQPATVALVAPVPAMLSLVAPNAGLPAPTPVAAALPAVTAAPSAGPAEPEYQAAQPPDRRCAEQNIARHYPPMLRERGIEGRVLLRVRVDEQGHAAEIQVQSGSGFRLFDEAAQRFTQGCRFAPARRGEQALASWVEYPVKFALN